MDTGKNDKIGEKTKYKTKYKLIMVVITEIATIIASAISGYNFSQSKSTYVDEESYKQTLGELERLELDNKQLKEQNEQLKEDNEQLKSEENQSESGEINDGDDVERVYLLDNYEMNDNNNCYKFTSIQMKGKTYYNGLKLSLSGKTVFYLNSKYKRLSFILGSVDNKETDKIAIIKVYADNKLVENNINHEDIISHGYSDECKEYTYNIEGCNELKIQWDDCVFSAYAIAELKVSN